MKTKETKNIIRKPQISLIKEVVDCINSIKFNDESPVNTKWGVIFPYWGVNDSRVVVLTDIRCDFGGDILNYFVLVGELNDISCRLS